MASWEKVRLTNEEVEIIVQELLTAADLWAATSADAYDCGKDKEGARDAVRSNICQELADTFDRCNKVEVS